MTEETRDELIEAVAESFNYLARDFNAVMVILYNGFKGINQMSDQELVDEYLGDLGDTEAEVLSEFFDSDDGEAEDDIVDELFKKIMKTPEYQAHWEKVKV